MTPQALKVCIQAAIRHKPMAHQEIVARWKVSNVTARRALDALIREGKAFALPRKDNYIRYSAQKPVPLEKRILEAMGEQKWFVKDLAEAMGEERHELSCKLKRMEEGRLVARVHVRYQFWQWVKVHNIESDWQPECEDEAALKKMVATQWRGTPWQGLECVL